MDEEDKQVLEFLQESERKARIPKKIKHKDVFPDVIKSKLKDIKMTDIKKHNFSELQLKGMKVADLKKIVREHNLHTTITNYSKLRKADLIGKMMKYAGGKATKKTKLQLEEEKKWSDRKKMGDGPITDKKYIKRGPEPVKKKKKKKANPKNKANPLLGATLAVAPDAVKPMFSQEEGGFIKGARKQFKNYQAKTKPAAKTKPTRTSARIQARKAAAGS